MGTNRGGEKWGPIRLVPGVTTGNAWAFMLASFFGIGMLTFVNIGQAYVMNEILGIPTNEQGTLSGNLAFATEIVVLCVVGGFGVASDRIGRRPVIVVGLIAMAIAYVLYPLAGSINELTAYRVVYAVGMAATTGMLGTIVNDYPEDISRGKMIAIGGIFNAFGILFVNGGLGRLPDYFLSQGFDGVAAGRYTHWLVAAIIIPVVMILAFTLQGGTPARKEERPPVSHLMRRGTGIDRTENSSGSQAKTPMRSMRAGPATRKGSYGCSRPPNRPSASRPHTSVTNRALMTKRPSSSVTVSESRARCPMGSNPFLINDAISAADIDTDSGPSNCDISSYLRRAERSAPAEALPGPSSNSSTGVTGRPRNAR